MKLVAWRPGNGAATGLLGAVVAHNVRSADGKHFLLKKGERLDQVGIARLAEASTEVHLIIPDPAELDEKEAGLRLAQAASGPGVRIKGLIGAQYHLVAANRGLLRVDREALRGMNDVEGLTIFTRFDHQPVEAGSLVAAVKCTPLLIASETVQSVERLAAVSIPLRIAPYHALKVGVLLLDKIDGVTRERFSEALHLKIGYFGGEVGSLVESRQLEKEIVPALQRLLDERHQVVMLAGASSLDPLEPLFPSLRQIGARMEKHGAPVHPGSLFWMAYAGEVPLFGLSSCEMFSHRTVLDLVLPRVFAGEKMRRAEIVELGYGGLLEVEMDWRFPRYRGAERTLD